MREELKKYADEAYEIVEYAANEIGPRVPGTDGENEMHDYMSGKLKDLGLKPVTEKFLFAPHSSIGGLPYAGWGGIIITLLNLLAIAFNFFGFAGNIANRQHTYAGSLVFLVLAVSYTVVLWIWIVCGVFKYKTWFDWCFKQEVSRNTYAEILPVDGKYDYTIFLSAHTDTSWTLKHSAAKCKLNPALIYVKIGLGALCVVIASLLSLAMFAIFLVCVCFITRNHSAQSVAQAKQVYDIMSYVCVGSAPILMAGSFLLTLYRERNPRAASPGAMDNATGIAIVYEAIKYFKENPDKMPERCRIVDLNIGAEEAGLRGSIAFARAHKADGMLENAYHINIDSVADKDYFEVIHGDAWLCRRFDKDMEKMCLDAMKEAGIEKPGNISNPVGGCDSTPFMKAGVKSITVAAQNPIMSEYYHTLYDVPERFDSEVVGLGLDVVLRVIDKIDGFERSKNKR